MISIVLHCLILMVLASYQISSALWLDYATPEFVLAAILAFGLSGDHFHTLWWVILGGIILDFTIGSLVGTHLILFSIFGFVAYQLSQHWLHQPGVSVAFLILLLGSGLYELMLSAIEYRQISIYFFTPVIVTAAIATLFYRLIIILSKRKEVIHIG